jgi:hypothetical protein
MYIRSIRIDAVHGFRQGAVDLELRRPDGTYAGWTVVAGRNGSGKTSFLQAIALAIAGPAAGRALTESFSGWINADNRRALAATRLTHSLDVDGFVKTGKRPGDFWTALSWTQADEGPEPLVTQEVLQDSTKQSAHRGPWNENPTGWFVVGYGPFRRLSPAGSKAQRNMSGQGFPARLVSLFDEEASLTEGVEWLKDLHTRRLEEEPGAEDLLNNVLALLSSGLLPEGERAVRVTSQGLWVSRNGLELPLDQLSDGYRTVTALVLDIVRHLHVTYKEFRLDLQDGVPTAPYEGVVLIDEIDAHLHVFPRLQFIVTSHSPFVCQAADPRGLIRLPAPGETRPAEHASDELFARVVNGGADDAVMSDLFGLERPHSDRSEQLRERAAQLEAAMITGRAGEGERAEWQSVTAQLPDDPDEDAERVVRRLEHTSK